MSSASGGLRPSDPLTKRHLLNSIFPLTPLGLRIKSPLHNLATLARYEITKIQKCIPFWNNDVQNRFGFWGSAPDPSGGAYDPPPAGSLVVRGFLPSAIAALRLRRLHFSI